MSIDEDEFNSSIFDKAVALSEVNDKLKEENQKLKNHIEATIKHLHYQCEQYGTNTWDDDLHMVDIIDKYLMNDVDETIRKLKDEIERLTKENQSISEANGYLLEQNENLFRSSL